MYTSKRQFRMIEFRDNGSAFTTPVHIDDLFPATSNQDDYEYIYALQDIIDDVLDMKPGDRLVFQSNRDNKNSKAILMRTR